VILLADQEKLDSPVLASLLHTVEFPVSVSDNVENLATWFATGSNPLVSHEIALSAVPIRVDIYEQPERSPAVLRELIVWAIHLIIQYWFQRGKPLGSRVLDGYESWSHVMGGILECASIDGFLGNVDDFCAQLVFDAHDIDTLLNAWIKRFRLREVNVFEIKSLIRQLELGTFPGVFPEKGTWKLTSYRPNRFSLVALKPRWIDGVKGIRLGSTRVRMDVMYVVQWARASARNIRRVHDLSRKMTYKTPPDPIELDHLRRRWARARATSH
jgi:hypothetical protein